MAIAEPAYILKTTDGGNNWKVVFEDKKVLELAQQRGLLQENSHDALQSIIEAVIGDNPVVVAEYKAGKTASIQFLIGQAMKVSKGSANPKLLLELFTQKLGE